MSLRDAFLAEILAQPHDDVPRLIYADWLDEHGDPRGEFIRVQCELEHMFGRDPRRLVLEQREKDLLGEYGAQWLAEDVRLNVLRKDKRIRFRRGFASEYSIAYPTSGPTLSPARTAKAPRLQTIFRKVPMISDLHITLPGTRMEFEETPSGRRGRRPRVRRVDEAPAATQLQWIAETSELKRISHLSIERRPGIGADGAAALATLKHLRVFSLNLSNNEIGDDGLTAIARARHLGPWRVLSLTNNAIGPKGVRHLLEEADVRSLTALNLAGNPLGNDGVLPLADAPLAQLEYLNLEKTGTDAQGVTALAGAPQLAKLRYLDLSENDLSGSRPAAVGIGAFSRPECQMRLLTFSLYRAQLTAGMATRLVNSPTLSRLVWLDLGKNQLDDVDAIAIAGSAHLQKLERLSLAGNQIGNSGLEALAASPHLRSLRWLSVAYNRISSRGLLALAKTEYLAELQTLVCWGNECDEVARAALIERFGAVVWV